MIRRRAAAIHVDLYLKGGAKDERLRGLLEATGREGGAAVRRFIATGLRGAPGAIRGPGS